MSTAPLRPSFCLALPLPPGEAIERLQTQLHASDQPIVSKRAGHHMTLTVTPAVRHFWSPWLNLEFEDATQAAADRPDPAAGPTSLHARFSPAPSLWTCFMAIYFTLASAGFLATMWAIAQWTMGRPPALLWGVLGCGLGCAVLWWVSWAGQKLAHDQMHLLRDAVETALLLAADPPPRS